MASLTVSIGRPEDLGDALALLYQGDASADFPALVEYYRSTTGGRKPGDGLLLARVGRQAVGAMLVTVIAGRLALAWPPRLWGQLPPGLATPDRVCEQLYHASLRFARQASVQLIQLSLGFYQQNLAGAAAAAGFTPLTQMLFLRRRTDLPLAPEFTVASGRLQLVPYHPQDHDLFVNVFAQCQTDADDCRELVGRRQPADVVASLVMHGEVVTESWWLVCDPQQRPMGCLMLARGVREPVFEVSYLGLVPGCRGYRLGQELLAFAVSRAREQGAAEIALAVDCRNHPARRLYARAGFDLAEERLVMIRWL